MFVTLDWVSFVLDLIQDHLGSIFENFSYSCLMLRLKRLRVESKVKLWSSSVLFFHEIILFIFEIPFLIVVLNLLLLSNYSWKLYCWRRRARWALVIDSILITIFWNISRFRLLITLIWVQSISTSMSIVDILGIFGCISSNLNWWTIAYVLIWTINFFNLRMMLSEGLFFLLMTFVIHHFPLW